MVYSAIHSFTYRCMYVFCTCHVLAYMHRCSVCVLCGLGYGREDLLCLMKVCVWSYCNCGELSVTYPVCNYLEPTAMYTYTLTHSDTYTHTHTHSLSLSQDAATSIPIDHGLQHHDRLQNANTQLDELIDHGRHSFSSLQTQHLTLKVRQKSST